jgi:transmembrane sensor
MSDDKHGCRPVDRHVREAARWLVRLEHPNLSPRVLLLWKKWQESPQNREAFDTLDWLWRAIHSSSGDIISALPPRKTLPSIHGLADEWTAPESRVAKTHATKTRFAGRGPRVAKLYEYDDGGLSHDNVARIYSVDEEAMYWYSRSTNERSMELSDRREFFAWLRRSPENISEILRIARVGDKVRRAKLLRSAVVSRESNVIDLPAVASRVSHDYQPATSNSPDAANQKTNNKRPLSWRLAAIAAAVTLTFMLAFVVESSRFDRSVTTGPGEWQNMALADGTVLHMGPRTTLKVEFADVRRIARLSQGEAVFEVAKDPLRPFTVSTNLIDVTAIGTRFGVSIDRGVTTTVSEGTVKITAHENDDNEKTVVMLNAGEELSVSDRGLDDRTYTKVDAERKLGWANGWLEFEGETIGQAAKEFNRRNVVQIEIEQPEIAARPLRGFYHFPVDASSAFARIIAEIHGLALIEDPSEKVIRLRTREAQP